MSDPTSSPAPALKNLDLIRILQTRAVMLEEAVQEIKLRLAAGPLHQSNGKGVLHALFRTKEGRVSREKALAALLTIGPLILELLPMLGVPLDSNPTFNLLITTLGASKWRARHQQDISADNA